MALSSMSLIKLEEKDVLEGQEKKSGVKQWKPGWNCSNDLRRFWLSGVKTGATGEGLISF